MRVDHATAHAAALHSSLAPSPGQSLAQAHDDSVEIKALPLPPDDRPSRDKWVAKLFRVANIEAAKYKPERLEIKRKAMLESAFNYFRGAATAFYLDLEKFAPAAPDEPRVRSPGDNHCRDFGTYRSVKNNVVYDINDFDEAADDVAFSRDILRNVTSWILAAREAGKTPEKQEQVALAAVEGYVNQIHEFAKHGGAQDFVLTSKNAEGPVKDLLLKMESTDNEKWVSKLTERDASGTLRFLPSTEVLPHPFLLDAFLHYFPPLKKAHITSVAAKEDSGVASRDLGRWYILEQFPKGPVKVLEVKQQLRSAMQGVPNMFVHVTANRAAQVSDAARTLVAEPYPQLDSFVVPAYALGAVPAETGEEVSFMTRERPALKAMIDDARLKTVEMVSVATQQGQLTAAKDARQPGKAKEISAWLKAHPDFAADIVKKAIKAADRQVRDYEAFKKLPPEV